MLQVKTENGIYRIYRGAEAGQPEAHKADRWYFHPADYDGGEVWCRDEGYASSDEAKAAAEDDAINVRLGEAEA